MAINFDSVTSHIRHTLGGDISSDNDYYSIVNEAGDFMASMFPWRWLEDTAAVVVADDANFSLLPIGFVELLGFAPRGLDSRNSLLPAAAAGRFFAVSMQEITDKRETAPAAQTHVDTYATVANGTFYIAIAYTNSGSAVPVPRLEVFPTPSTNGDASLHGDDDCKLTIWYRRAWGQISTPSTIFSLPQWMEPLYLQCVRAITRGYEEEDIATANSRLSEVASGPLFITAVQRDSLIESTTLRVVRRDTPTGLANLAINEGAMEAAANAPR